jgi:hypothetical protein
MTGTPWSEIVAIFELDGDQQDLAVHQFLSDTRHQAFFRKLTASLCNRYSIRLEMWGDDVHVIVQQVAWGMLVDQAQHTWASAYDSWSQAMALGAQNKVKAFAESADYLGVSGASTLTRRQRMLEARRQAMLAGGFEASPQDVVDAHNQEMHRTRSDPARQGVLATTEDMIRLGTLPLEFANDPTTYMPSTGSESDCPLLTTDAKELIRKVLIRCDATNGTMRQVAHAVYGQALSEPPFIATAREAAEISGLGVDKVRRHLREVDDLLRQILAEEYGITGASASA